MKKDHLIEIIFLAIVFGGLLYVGPGALFQHKLGHEKPVQYGATDGFLYAMLSEHVYETGNFRYNPFYSTAGFDDSIAYHPPMLMHITAAFAHLSGLSAYDSLSFIMAVFVLFAAFIMYWLIRSFNKKVALLSVPVFVFLYLSRFLIGYIWGEALLLMGSFFLIALFFIVSKKEIKHWWIPAGILIAATINTHTSETIWFYGFAVFMLGVQFIFRKLKKSDLKFWLKQIGLATLLAIIISFNYLIIFYNGYVQVTGESYTSLKAMTPEQFGAIQVPPLFDFHWALYIILIGVVISIILAYKKPHTALLASGFMFLIGLTNYIGLHYRAFQTRFLWPIYLALFFGLAVYFVVKHIFKKNILVPAVIGIVLAGILWQSYAIPVNVDIIFEGQWEGFKWLGKNTDKESRTLFLFGYGYSQDLRLVKRLVFLIDPNDLAAMYNEGKKRRLMEIEPILQNEMHLIYRKSFFDFGYYAKEQNITIHKAPMDLCGFDYYVIDRKSPIMQDLAKAAIDLGNTLLEHGMTPVYQNDHVVVLKNNNIGGECLE